MLLAREVSFATDECIFDEGGKADRFWISYTGTVALDVHVPGCRAAVIETLDAGELLACSWLVPPHHWHSGGRASSLVGAYEFDATAVCELRWKDPELDHALLTYVAGAIAGRLRSARVRLLDLYAPHGAGEVP